MSKQTMDDFERYLRLERGLAENTITSYFFDLQQFLQSVKNVPEKATRDEIQKFLGKRLALGDSPLTVTRKLFAIRRLYCFLLDDEIIKRDPTLGIPLPRRDWKIQHAVTLAELDAMLALLGDTAVDIRDRAMLLVLFGSGLRASELLNLKLADIDLEESIVRVWDGKGAKDGIVPLSLVSIAALREYLEKSRPKFDPKGESPFLFVSMGNGAQGQQFSRQELFIRVTELSQKAVGKKLSPHRFRAGCATALLEGGSDIRDTQRIMRHADIDTTQRYFGISMAFLRTAYFKSHPRAKEATR